MRAIAFAVFLALAFGVAVALAVDFFGPDFRVVGVGSLLYLVPVGFALFWFTRSRGADHSKKSEAATRQEIADVLTEKYEKGVNEILNGPITSEAEFRKWLQAEGMWTGDLLATMRERGCTKQELSDVTTLRDVPLGAYSSDPDRNHQLSMVAVRLRRLKGVIDHYAGRPAEAVARYG